MGKTNNTLNVNREKFAQEFVLTGNAAEAYRTAYPGSKKWTTESLYSRASTLLKDSKVSARVEELRGEVKEKFDISAERLLLEQSRIALFDFRRLWDEDGKIREPKDFPDDVAAAVSSVKVSKVRSIGKDEEFETETIVELKLWNKNQSIDSLMKHKGLYKKDNKQLGISSLAEALREIDRKRNDSPD